MSIAAAGSTAAGDEKTFLSKRKKKEKMPRLSFSDEMNGDEGSEFGGMSQSTNKRYPPRVNVLLLRADACAPACELLLHTSDDANYPFGYTCYAGLALASEHITRSLSCADARSVDLSAAEPLCPACLVVNKCAELDILEFPKCPSATTNLVVVKPSKPLEHELKVLRVEGDPTPWMPPATVEFP